MEKYEGGHFISYTKVNSKQIKVFIFKSSNCTNIGINLHDYGYLDMTTKKNKQKRKKIDKLNFIKSKLNFIMLQRTLTTE